MSEVEPEYLEELCRVLHDAYEEAARKHNWSTQMKSRVPWENVPEENKATMRDAVTALMEHYDPEFGR